MCMQCMFTIFPNLTRLSLSSFLPLSFLFFSHFNAHNKYGNSCPPSSPSPAAPSLLPAFHLHSFVSIIAAVCACLPLLLSTPVRVWLVASNDAKVEIYKKNDTIEGKIIWLKDFQDETSKDKTDIHNPNEQLRNRPIKNLVFLEGFQKELNKNKWSGGTIYDAKSGKTYKGWMKPDGEKKLKLRGYVGFSLIGRTEEWTRQ